MDGMLGKAMAVLGALGGAPGSPCGDYVTTPEVCEQVMAQQAQAEAGRRQRVEMHIHTGLRDPYAVEGQGVQGTGRAGGQAARTWPLPEAEVDFDEAVAAEHAKRARGEGQGWSGYYKARALAAPPSTVPVVLPAVVPIPGPSVPELGEHVRGPGREAAGEP